MCVSLSHLARWGVGSILVCSSSRVQQVKVAVVRIALIATFALRPSWSQAIHDDPYKVYISEQVCVWRMYLHQRSPPFSNIWGCYSHQHERGIKIKN